MKQLSVYQRISEIIHLSKRGPFSFEIIQERIRALFEVQGIEPIYSIRTLQRDLKEVRELHGIDIKFNKRTNQYEVNDEESTPIRAAILESFDLIHTFQLNKGLDQIVFFDDRKSKGTEFLSDLVNAIKNKFLVRIIHHPGWTPNENLREVKPIALKEFKNTWYLIAFNESNKLRNYGLDRINYLEVSKRSFGSIPDVNLESSFKDVFGILNPQGEKAENVILKFTSRQGYYIKSKPIHSSQRIEEENDEDLKISLSLKINTELINEILSFGSEVLVLEPQHLSEKIKGIALAVAQGKLENNF